MIIVKDIYKRYGDLEILKGLNLSVDSGQTVSIVGASGAGKTTLIRYLINNLQKQKGLSQTEVLSTTFNLLYQYEINDIK